MIDKIHSDCEFNNLGEKIIKNPMKVIKAMKKLTEKKMSDCESCYYFGDKRVVQQCEWWKRHMISAKVAKKYLGCNFYFHL